MSHNLLHTKNRTSRAVKGGVCLDIKAQTHIVAEATKTRQ